MAHDPEITRAAERDLGVSLPADYVRFMAGVADVPGGRVEIGDHELFLGPIEKLARQNEGYQPETTAPGLGLFGTDGGLEAFGFDARDGRMQIVMIPFVPMTWNEAIACGRTFAEFLDNLRQDDCFSAADEVETTHDG